MKNSADKWCATLSSLSENFKESLVAFFGAEAWEKVGLQQLSDDDDGYKEKEKQQLHSDNDKFILPWLLASSYEQHCQRVESLFKYLSDLFVCNEEITVGVPLDTLVSLIKCCLGRVSVSGVPATDICPRIISSSLAFCLCLIKSSHVALRPFSSSLATEILTTLVWVHLHEKERTYWAAIPIIYESLSALLLRFGPGTNLHVTCDRLRGVIKDHLVATVENTEVSLVQKHVPLPHRKRKRQEKPTVETVACSDQFIPPDKDVFVSCCKFLEIFFNCVGPFVKRGFYVEVQRHVSKILLQVVGNTGRSTVSSEGRISLLKLLGVFVCQSVHSVPRPLHLASRIFSAFHCDPNDEIRRLSLQYVSLVKGLCRPILPSIESPAAVAETFQLPLSTVTLENSISQDGGGKHQDTDKVVTHVINIDEESSGSEYGEEAAAAFQVNLREQQETDAGENTTTAAAVGQQDSSKQESHTGRTSSDEEPDIVCIDDPPLPKRYKINVENENDRFISEKKDSCSVSNVSSVHQMLKDFVDDD